MMRGAKRNKYLERKILMPTPTQQRQHHIWTTIQRLIRESRVKTLRSISEEHSFYIYRTDTNAVLARGIQGFEAAKVKANELRKSQGLKWDEVKFKAERGNQVSGSASRGSGAASAKTQKRIQFGVSRDGKTFTNAYGERSRVEYSRNYNPSKGRRFRGYYDKHGNFHDID